MTGLGTNYDRDRDVPLTDDQKIELGRSLLDFFYPEGTVEEPRGQTAATEWLGNIGFDMVEWAQPNDQILLCLLWRFTQDQMHLTDEFILEFSGHDALIITVFNRGKEWAG